MAEIILNEPGVRALIGKGEAASVAEHVGMGEQGQGRGGSEMSGFLCSRHRDPEPDPTTAPDRRPRASP